MSQVDSAPSLNNPSPSRGPSPSPSPSPEKNNTILGLSPTIILLIVVGLVAFGVIYNNEKKE